MDIFHEASLSVIVYLSILCSHGSYSIFHCYSCFSFELRGEYTTAFRQFLDSKGTLPQLSCTGARAHNSVAERKHRHVIETACTSIASFVPSHFWAKAVSTVVYLINLHPSSRLEGKCPREVLFGFSPGYDHLRVFCCTCYALPPCERTKLTPQLVECVFLGYNLKHKGYRCYDPSTHRVRISRDVTFVDDHHFFHSTTTPYPLAQSNSFFYLPPIPSTTTKSRSPPSAPSTLPPVSTAPPYPLHYSRHSQPPTVTFVPAPSDTPASATEVPADDPQLVAQRYALRDRTTISAPD